jgi:hypothetical protein
MSALGVERVSGLPLPIMNLMLALPRKIARCVELVTSSVTAHDRHAFHMRH